MDTLRVCLVGWILGSKKKTFLVGIWLKGGEGKKLVGFKCFLSGLTKMFSPKLKED